MWFQAPSHGIDFTAGPRSPRLAVVAGAEVSEQVTPIMLPPMPFQPAGAARARRRERVLAEERSLICSMRPLNRARTTSRTSGGLHLCKPRETPTEPRVAHRVAHRQTDFTAGMVVPRRPQ